MKITDVLGGRYQLVQRKTIKVTNYPKSHFYSLRHTPKNKAKSHLYSEWEFWITLLFSNFIIKPPKNAAKSHFYSEWKIWVTVLFSNARTE